jgi:polyhydroxyalkanoate synthesis regulator phasin
MSDKKKETSKKRSGTDRARRIWLAGIGAYGRAFTEAQEALKDVSGEASEVFDNLVQKGEMIETAVQSKRKDVMSKVGVPSFDMPDIDIPDINISERIEKMRSRLEGRHGRADVSDIEARLDRIEAKLDALLSAQDARQPARARKTAVKKAAAKKVTAKKETSKKPSRKASPGQNASGQSSPEMGRNRPKPD